MISITNVLSYSPDYVVSILNERIGDIAESIGCYCADPVSDFTRSRKLPCDVLMKLIIQFQSKALNCEYLITLRILNHYQPNLLSVSSAIS